MTRLSGWGRFPVVEGFERLSPDLGAACRGVSLTRGLGRSYGDASLPSCVGGEVAATRLGNCILAFDRERGVLRAEAGFTLEELDAIGRPAGWVSPVCPGTSQVTLGGMVACDVHGKNHHRRGTFGEHVTSLRMLVADGRVLEVSPTEEPELFAATLGGMGLTGHLLEVEVQLERVNSPWIAAEQEIASDLEDLVLRLRQASQTWPYTTAWVNALARGRGMGQGVVTKGRWAEPERSPRGNPPRLRRMGVPVECPGWVLGPVSMRAFNAGFYAAHKFKRQRRVMHPDRFFYPLDVLRNWNRMYGRQGLIQYQCVIPMDAEDGVAPITRFFETLIGCGGGSLLTVLKDCGPAGTGMMSFPRPGVSVALDLPMRGRSTQALVDALNRSVLAEGGRIYLAKDALTRAEDFHAMEPRLEGWNAVRRRWDPEGTLKSALSVRLLGDEA
ncbi:MAG: FAD-binding oxidoreductase [Planctomycetota bacterium]|nr:FAD-binding oxidoreductase [Planctomycetota bacterium]